MTLRFLPLRLLVCLLLSLFSSVPLIAGESQTTAHTDPINLTPSVIAAIDHFYNADYDGALARFETILHTNPENPMASNYVLQMLIFRELYHQDLLDTTYYAHDSFLTSKRAVQVSPAARSRIQELESTVITLCDREVRMNPNSKDALFARAYGRGLHAVFITLVDHSFVAAARQGLDARNDSERVLKIDPAYDDAKMAVGIQQFAVASLPRLLRLMVGMAGVGGNKEHGLELLRQAAAHGIVTPIESRTALSLFLRHDGRYPEALAVARGLAQQFPRNYLFRLEEANLAKDSGDGPHAILVYKAVLADSRHPGYFYDPRLQLAWFGLADTERGQTDFTSAARHYLEAADQPNCSDWLRRRALVNAGEMFDLFHDRGNAIKQYRLASEGGGDQSQADLAKRYLKAPYTGK